MKINVTYEEADLKRVIRTDLAHQGITATDADITLNFKKSGGHTATILVEVAGGEVPAAAPVEITPVETAPLRAPEARKPPPREPAPPLEVVEGGNNPVDMSDVLGQSMKVARQGGGMFPVPERTLMSGESYEFPGSPEDNKR